MAASGLGYMQQLLNSVERHWRTANNELGGEGIVLPFEYTLTRFSADAAAFTAAFVAANNADVRVRTARAERELARTSLLSVVPRFRAALLAFLPQMGWAHNVPPRPALRASEGVFLSPLRDVARIWASANALSGVPGFTPPLLLDAGYGLADLNAGIARVEAAYRALDDAEVAARLLRDKRDAIFVPLHTRLVHYRAVILARTGAESALSLSLPRVTPRRGTTPDAVEAKGVWNPETRRARLTWNPAGRTDVVRARIMWCAGTRWTSKTARTAPETVDFSSGTVETSAGIAGASGSVLYKLVVTTKTGNEAGSAAVLVTISAP